MVALDTAIRGWPPLLPTKCWEDLSIHPVLACRQISQAKHCAGNRNMAHSASTGPVVPDILLWDIRATRRLRRLWMPDESCRRQIYRPPQAGRRGRGVFTNQRVSRQQMFFRRTIPHLARVGDIIRFAGEIADQ